MKQAMSSLSFCRGICWKAFSRVRDAEIHVDDAQSKMTHTVTALNLRILSSDVFLDSDTDYHR